MKIDLPTDMLRTFGWVCPVAGCSEHGQAQIKRGELRMLQHGQCPTHGVPFVPLLDAMDTAINCALAFIFDRSLLPPMHMQKHLQTVDPQTRRYLVYNWILNGTAVRASGDLTFYFRVLELNQMAFIKPGLALFGDARLQRNCVLQLKAVIEQKVARFVNAVNDRTRALIPPVEWQPPYGLNITPFDRWFRTDWENLKPMIAETLADPHLDQSPERYKQLLDLLVQGRTAVKYFGALDVYASELSSPQLVIRYAPFLKIPRLVQPLTPQEIETYLRQCDQEPPIVASLPPSSPRQAQKAESPLAPEIPISLAQQIDTENLSNHQMNSFASATTEVFATANTSPNSATEIVQKSYKAGFQAVLPVGLFMNEPNPATRTALERAAQGVIRRTTANYITNHSRVVDSLCEQFAPAVIAAAPNPNQHYGNLRQLTHSSANIADSAHYLLNISNKNYRQTQKKLAAFDRLLHQIHFFSIRHHGCLQDIAVPI